MSRFTRVVRAVAGAAVAAGVYVAAKAWRKRSGAEGPAAKPLSKSERKAARKAAMARAAGRG